MSHAELRRLDAVAARLPFAVDDYDAANRAFARWRETRTEANRKTVDLWTYCYVQRYFLLRFARETAATAPDLDETIATAFKRVHASYETVRDATRFSHFVSVVCVNTFRNYRRGRRAFEPLDEATPGAPSEPAEAADAPIVRRAVETAIAELPGAVQEVARLRLLDRMEYTAISERVGLAVPSLRAYVSKALHRLREDPHLRALYYRDVLPPDAEPSGLRRLAPDSRGSGLRRRPGGV